MKGEGGGPPGAMKLFANPHRKLQIFQFLTNFRFKIYLPEIAPYITIPDELEALYALVSWEWERSNACKHGF